MWLHIIILWAIMRRVWVLKNTIDEELALVVRMHYYITGGQRDWGMVAIAKAKIGSAPRGDLGLRVVFTHTVLLELLIELVLSLTVWYSFVGVVGMINYLGIIGR